MPHLFTCTLHHGDIYCQINGTRLPRIQTYGSTAEVGNELPCQVDTANHADCYAVAVIKDRTVVGHLPRKISYTTSLFLCKGGSINISKAKQLLESAPVDHPIDDEETFMFPKKKARIQFSSQKSSLIWVQLEGITLKTE